MPEVQIDERINLLDLFSGIGGFHLGLTQAGFKFDWVGFSEIDKYAKETYSKRFPGAVNLGDVTTIRPEDLPKDIDILCGGFPCQTFSIAGKRAGFNDTRGTLFFEIARILRYFRDAGKPIPYFILENVKGLLNHDDGRTFAAIYGVLADLDYTIECQLLNTRWFLPQNRERIYLVGHLGARSGRKVFPIGENDSLFDKKDRAKKRRTQAEYSTTIRDGIGSKADGTFVMLNQIGTIGKDSEATRVYDTTCARTIKNGGGMGAKTGLYCVNDGASLKYQSEMYEMSPCLKASRSDYLLKSNQFIRRLTPTECERLQGFPDGWTEGQSDTQRYKQLGNAVSVPVVKAVGEGILCQRNQAEKH